MISRLLQYRLSAVFATKYIGFRVHKGWHSLGVRRGLECWVGAWRAPSRLALKGVYKRHHKWINKGLGFRVYWKKDDQGHTMNIYSAIYKCNCSSLSKGPVFGPQNPTAPLYKDLKSDHNLENYPSCSETWGSREWAREFELLRPRDTCLQLAAPTDSLPKFRLRLI